MRADVLNEAGLRLAAELRARFDARAGIPAPFPDSGEDLGAIDFAPSAVLAAIVARPEPTMLLTTRNANLRAHAGQVAFPGGRADAEDDGPVATALREAQEEIALPPRRGDSDRRGRAASSTAQRLFDRSRRRRHPARSAARRRTNARSPTSSRCRSPRSLDAGNQTLR